MNLEELATSWLRVRAKDLYTAASKADSAYQSTSAIGLMSKYVAGKYRLAAVLLDAAAAEIEENPAVLTGSIPPPSADATATPGER